MKKIVLAAFLFVSTISTNLLADILKSTTSSAELDYVKTNIKTSDNFNDHPIFSLTDFTLTFKIEEDCSTNIRNRKYY